MNEQVCIKIASSMENAIQMQLGIVIYSEFPFLRTDSYSHANTIVVGRNFQIISDRSYPLHT